MGRTENQKVFGKKSDKSTNYKRTGMHLHLQQPNLSIFKTK